MKSGRSERALAYVNRGARPEAYNDFGLVWIRMLAKVFRQRLRQLSK